MVSVIIPALNEAKWLPGLLADLSRQTYVDHEVIVADARSTDGTPEVARSFGAVVVEGGLPGVGRNAGARVARGDYFLFLDADVRIGRRFIEEAMRELRARRIGLATCRFQRDTHSTGVTLLYTGYNAIVSGSQFFWPSLAGGAMLLISRRLFERLEGYDERLRVTEDNDLISRAVKTARFRILWSVRCVVSSRRLQKEGLAPFVWKAIFTKAFLLFQGRKAPNRPIRYEYGNFAPPENGSRGVLVRPGDSRALIALGAPEGIDASGAIDTTSQQERSARP